MDVEETEAIRAQRGTHCCTNLQFIYLSQKRVDTRTGSMANTSLRGAVHKTSVVLCKVLGEGYVNIPVIDQVTC